MKFYPDSGNSNNVVDYHLAIATDQLECSTTQLGHGMNLDACIRVPSVMMTSTMMKGPMNGSSKNTSDVLHPAEEHMRGTDANSICVGCTH